jgi:hypothetical protein
MGTLRIKEELSYYMYWIETMTKKFCSSDYLTGAAQEPGRRQVQGPLSGFSVVIVANRHRTFGRPGPTKTHLVIDPVQSRS